MSKEINFNVYLGTVRGALAYSECRKDKRSKYNLELVESEITALDWGRKDQEILIGKKNGKVQLYNALLGKHTKDISEDIEGEGAVVGFGCFNKSIVIGRRNGVVNIWKKLENDSFTLNLDEESTMECLSFNTGRQLIATGGEKNDLKLWDVEKKTAVFKAKSMGHDQLNLPIPTSVRGICFFPSEENLVACATKEGFVLLYDDRAQRRPVTKYFEVKASFTTITTAHSERQCFVGTTKGYIQLLDLRHNKCLKTFKSFTGGITSIVCDPVEPFIATASLDRHLRIHNYETKELVYKEYMKIGLTKLIMKPIIKEEIEEVVEVNAADIEYDDIFDKMETIVDDASPKKTKRKVKNKTTATKKSRTD